MYVCEGDTGLSEACGVWFVFAGTSGYYELAAARGLAQRTRRSSAPGLAALPPVPVPGTSSPATQTAQSSHVPPADHTAVESVVESGSSEGWRLEGLDGGTPQLPPRQSRGKASAPHTAPLG